MADGQDGVKLGDDGLPTEFRIFRAGKNETSKGTFRFTPESAASVIAVYEDQGNKLVIDYEHQTAANPPIPAPSAGTFIPEVRDGELWATAIKWTERASEFLRGKEYLYFSPWFDHDAKGRITSLRNVALTNLPATKDLPTLVAAKASTEELREMPMTEDVRKALEALWVAMQEGMKEGGEMPEDEEMRKLLGAALAALSPADAEPAKEDPPAPAPEVEALSEVVALTGKSTVAEAMGKIASWKDASTQVAALSKRVSELETEKRDREFEAAISDGRSAGKITPAMLDGKFIKSLRGSADGVATLRSWLEDAPVVLKTTELSQPKTADGIVLTEEETRYAKLQGLDLKDLVAHKTRRNSERTGG